MEIDRRTFLRRSGACLAAFAAAGLALPSTVGAAGDEPTWGYGPTDGPDDWGRLSPSWRTCDRGSRQSPIDLPLGRPATPEAASVRLRYRAGKVQVFDTGHAIRFLPGGQNVAIIHGRPYVLDQFHEHNPSEHTRRGQHLPGELHFVHVDEKGRHAVLGLLLQESPAGGPADELLDAIPPDVGKEKQTIAASYDLSQLFPRNGATFRYSGSLTTPGCEEDIEWFVFATPARVKPSVIESFRRANPGNSRPVQPLDGRLIESARIRV